MDNLAVAGERHGSRLVDGLADLVSAEFPGTAAKRNAAVAVHPAAMRCGDSPDRVFHGNAGGILGLLCRLLNAAHGLVELGDDALAQATRLAHSVAALTHAVFCNLGNPT